jgi:hypothetical protein
VTLPERLNVLGRADEARLRSRIQVFGHVNSIPSATPGGAGEQSLWVPVLRIPPAVLALRRPGVTEFPSKTQWD